MKIGDKIHLLSYGEIVKLSTCEKGSNIAVDGFLQTVYGIHRDIFDKNQNMALTIRLIQPDSFVVKEFSFVFPIEVIRPTYKVELI